MTAVTDKGRTLGSGRTYTTESGFWPALRDKVDAKRSLETQILREELFKQQLWRFKLFGDMAVSLGNGGQMRVRPRKESRLPKRMRKS